MFVHCPFNCETGEECGILTPCDETSVYAPNVVTPNDDIANSRRRLKNEQGLDVMQYTGLLVREYMEMRILNKMINKKLPLYNRNYSKNEVIERVATKPELRYFIIDAIAINEID